MRALITGSNGQVGQALLASAPNGVEAIACGRETLDLTDPATIRRTLEDRAPAVVINTAAYTSVDRAESEEQEAYQVNAAGVVALASVCAEHDIPLVHLSSDFVFDGNRSRPYTPADEASPLSAYGRSKLGGEIAALAHARNLVIRTSWVYGNHGQNFVKTMLRLLSQKNELGVVSDQIGTPTHADSLARAIWVLSRKQAKGLLHFTDAGVASWYDFAVAVQEEGLKLGLLRREIPILPIGTADYPTPAKRPRYSVLDKTQCWEVLDGRSRHWRVELRSMLAAEKELHG